MEILHEHPEYQSEIERAEAIRTAMERIVNILMKDDAD